MQWHLFAVEMSFIVCPHCFSLRFYPYMGFELGRKYQCQDCLHIGPAVLEFETEEAYLAVMAAQENE